MIQPRLTTWGEAVDRYGLDGVLTQSDSYAGDERLISLDGPVEIETLPLDFQDLDKWAGVPTGAHALLGVVVSGNLTVAGPIVNAESDFGPFLYVAGDLRASDVYTAGSEVAVAGDLTVTRSLVGYYNHGITRVHGATRSEVVLPLEHVLELHGTLNARLVVGGNFLRIGQPERAAVEHWAGRVSGLDDEWLPGLGGDNRALRLLDPALFDWTEWLELDAGEQEDEDDLDYIYLNQGRVLRAVVERRSLLRGDRSWAPPQRAVSG